MLVLWIIFHNSLIVPKKVERGPFCFGMVLYFMLETLDAFKIKNLVLIIKVHRAQKMDYSEWDWQKTSHCNSRELFLERKTPTENNSWKKFPVFRHFFTVVYGLVSDCSICLVLSTFSDQNVSFERRYLEIFNEVNDFHALCSFVTLLYNERFDNKWKSVVRNIVFHGSFERLTALWASSGAATLVKAGLSNLLAVLAWT